jgi:hypothetical protein
MPISRFTLGVLAALLWILSPLAARAAHPLITKHRQAGAI